MFIGKTFDQVDLGEKIRDAFSGTCRNQRGEDVAQGEGKKLISNEVPLL